MASRPSNIGFREIEPVLELARRHGLDLSSMLDVNELGLDFRVVTAVDRLGMHWVLRIPRRPDVVKKIEREARALSLLRPRLPFAIPDWRIVSAELVAYPKLNDLTAIHVDAATSELTWNIDQNSDTFVMTLGRSLAALHEVPMHDAIQGGLSVSTPGEMRGQIARDIDQIKDAFDIHPDLERRWRVWLDDDDSWPNRSVVVHGDLYAGHILVNEKSEITGMIDWTEAEIGDPSVDFSAHLLLFGEASLVRLMHHYEAAGGSVWPGMARHIGERLAASPIKYALFALESGEAVHLEAVEAQLLQT